MQQIVCAEWAALAQRGVVDVDAAARDQPARLALAAGEAALDEEIDDVALAEGRLLEPADVLHGRYVMLRKGKRQRHLVVVSG